MNGTESIPVVKDWVNVRVTRETRDRINEVASRYLGYRETIDDLLNKALDALERQEGKK